MKTIGIWLCFKQIPLFLFFQKIAETINGFCPELRKHPGLPHSKLKTYAKSTSKSQFLLFGMQTIRRDLPRFYQFCYVCRNLQKLAQVERVCRTLLKYPAAPRQIQKKVKTCKKMFLKNVGIWICFKLIPLFVCCLFEIWRNVPKSRDCAENCVSTLGRPTPHANK